MSRCVIVGGADIADHETIGRHLRPDDFKIFCDSGLRHAGLLSVTPDLIVGDFDSHEKPDSPVETIVLPCEKDDTDTVFAAKEAVKRGFSDFLLIGTIGGRIDHTLGNLSILLMLHEQGKKAVMLDDYSEITVAGKEVSYVDGSFSYFSLLCIDGSAKGVNIVNAKYPLSDAEITSDYPYGISNEPLPGKTAEITVREGRLLLVKSKH